MPAGVPYHPPAGRNTWNTPAALIDPLTVFAGGPVDLDPCSNPTSKVPARREFMVEHGDDGLWLPWHIPDVPVTVYVNPPFDDLKSWAEKAKKEAELGAEILFLLPARTDTKAWHEHVATANAVLFWRGRLTFLGAEHPAPFPVALAYWGPRVKRFMEVFGKHGLAVTHWKQEAKQD